MSNWDPHQSYSWVLATASGGIYGFDASAFIIDSSAFANLHTGSFAVAVQGNSLVVTYGATLTPPTVTGYGPWTNGTFQLIFSGPNGQGYTVLSSTNAALPLATWTPLTTGTFGAGSVTFTDTSATNDMRFYRIKSP